MESREETRRAGSSADLISRQGPRQQGPPRGGFQPWIQPHHQKPCPYSSPPQGEGQRGEEAARGCGRLWDTRPSPACVAVTPRVRRTSKRTRLCCTGMLGHLLGAGDDREGRRGSPRAEAVSARVGTTGKGGRSGLLQRQRRAGRSLYGRRQRGQAGIPGLSSPLLLSTVIVVLCMQVPGRRAGGSPLFCLLL